MIAIIDYGMGNLRSVQKAVEKYSKNCYITSDPQGLDKAEKIIMPGVGAMSGAMNALRQRNLVGAIKNNIFKKPYLGICLGLQLLFDTSEEGKSTRGLGILKGKVVRFAKKLKVPHMGWNNIQFQAKKCPIFKNIRASSYFYFCHSYYVVPEDKSIICAATAYGAPFTAGICRGNLYAVQFHPEKSQENGLKILENFVNLPC